MSHRKPKSIVDKLKAYYRYAEKEAAELAPYYVTGDGVMYAQPKEVLRSKAVIQQLSAFEELRQELKDKNKRGAQLIVSES